MSSEEELKEILWFPPVESLSKALEQIIPNENKNFFLVSELHRFDQIGYDLQLSIINDIISKFGKENVIIYTETPSKYKDHIHNPKLVASYMAFAVTNYASSHDIDIAFSDIDECIRTAEGSCNDLYGADILAKTVDKKCCIVICGLFHIGPLYKFFTESNTEYNVQTFNAIGIEKFFHFIPSIDTARGGPKLTEENFEFITTFSIIEDIAEDEVPKFGGSKNQLKKRKSKKKKSKKRFFTKKKTKKRKM